MKKSKLILFLIISILFLSGCGSVKIDKALENMKDLKSFTMKFESTENGKASSSVFEIDVVNRITKETSYVGDKEIVSYSQVVDNNLISYSKGLFGDNWIRSEVESDLEIDSILSDVKASEYGIDELDLLLSFDSDLFKKVKSDIKGTYKYKINLDELEEYVDMDYYVYTDGKYITKIEIISGSDSEVLTFSNINSTFVTIPDDVKDNSKKINELDFSGIDISSIDEIDIPDMDASGLKDLIDQAKEYTNSDEFKDQIQKAQDYMNSDEFKDQMQKAQDYMNSEEYQRQMQEAQERARAFLNR